MRRRQKGLTLIELIIVIAIIAILAAVIVPRLGGFLGRGKKAAFEGETATLQTAVDAYYADPDVKRYDLEGKPEGPGLYPTYSGKGAKWPSDNWPRNEKEARDKEESPIINMDFLMSHGSYDTKGHIAEGYIGDYAKSACGYNKEKGDMDELPGHYAWYVNENGKVSVRYYDPKTKKWKEGYQGVYP